MHSFDKTSVEKLIAAHKEGDMVGAHKAALEATDTENLVISCMYPQSAYNDSQIVDLLEAKLQVLDTTTVDLAYGLYVPEILGLVLSYLGDYPGAEEVTENGEVSSESIRSSEGEDASGA